MAVTATTAAAAATRRVSARDFVRLKLRVTANAFRGQGWRIALFVLGLFFGLWFAVGGFLLFAAPGLADSRDAAVLVASLGGAVLVMGWLLVPLVFFGVDETLDPARFALLPLGRRTVVTGMFAAALVGVPALALLLATSGLVLSAAMLGGAASAVVTAVGVVLGLFVCVAASRAVTSAFATMLRSRRMRDLAAVFLAVCAAALGPVQILAINTMENADWARFTGVAEVLGWTPLAAPYSMGFDAAAGRWWAVPVKLLIGLATVLVLLWWWSRSLESAMVGAATASRGRGPARTAAGAEGAVAQLFPPALRRLPRTRAGAIVAREARYWWRDTRRRASLISVGVVGVFVPVVVNLGTQGFRFGSAGQSPTRLALSMVFVGALTALSLVNQFGYDGSAYAANVVAGVPGRTELAARAAGFSLYTVPLLGAISVLIALLVRQPGWIAVAAGALFAAYGCGLAVTVVTSVLGAYALPETANPFAMNTGSSMAKGLLSFASLIGTAVLAIPAVVAAALLPGALLWLVLPVGLAYGAGAAALGTHIAGDVLDHRTPEVLQLVTPRR